MHKQCKNHIELIRNLIDKASYWKKRFDVSGDIEHFDKAEIYSTSAKEYLPEHLQDLTLKNLCELQEFSRKQLQKSTGRN